MHPGQATGDPSTMIRAGSASARHGTRRGLPYAPRPCRPGPPPPCSPSCVVLGACDTGDGRELREPTAAERGGVPTTTTTTTSRQPRPDAARSGRCVGADRRHLGGDARRRPARPFALQLPVGARRRDRRPLHVRRRGPLAAAHVDRATGRHRRAGAAGDRRRRRRLRPLGGRRHRAVVGRERRGRHRSPAPSRASTTSAPGWGGPCPPRRRDRTRTASALYALAQQAELPDGFTGADLRRSPTPPPSPSPSSPAPTRRAG